MLTPEYLDELVESTSTAASEFNMYLTNKVIDSVIAQFEFNGKIAISPSSKHYIDLMKRSGILIEDIEREIEKRLPGLDKKIKDAFYQAGYEINENINKMVSDMVEGDKELKNYINKAPRLENLTEDEKKILNAAYKRTNGEIRNLTKTTAANINSQFVKSCDSAWWKSTHGISPATAIREAIDEVSKHGATIIYKNKETGKERRMSVESAVRMCVMTGLNQSNSEITLSACANAGIKNVLVSSHLGARYTNKIEPANHMSWQGKIYTLSDKLIKKYGGTEQIKSKNTLANIFNKLKSWFDKNKESRYEDFETVTGYGTITGLSGINCRHTFFPFYKGMKNNQPQYDSEENKQAYDISQKKRAYERKIRESKKKLFEVKHALKIVNDDKLKEELNQSKETIENEFNKYNGQYTAFCLENGQKRNEDRLYVGKK
jgi:hypothetical protein